MKNYVTVRKNYGDLTSEYPHSPEDQEQSFVDYLEDQLDNNGLRLISHGWYGGTSFCHFVFEVVGQSE